MGTLVLRQDLGLGMAFLILKYLQLKSPWGWSLSNLVALLRMNPFLHRDLGAWLSRPFGPRQSR